MKNSNILKQIVYAEDDLDDAEFFVEAITTISSSISVTVVENGELLMKHLAAANALPDIIFLDLNMPLKNGFECLKEIYSNEKYSQLTTIILSTSSHPDQIKLTYDLGAKHYITKATNFDLFKKNLKEIISTHLRF